MKTTRRRFLKTTGTATATLGFPTIIPSSALGDAEKPAPSNRIVMGGIGLGNKGRGDHEDFLRHGEVQYVAVCDVDGGKRFLTFKYPNGIQITHNKPGVGNMRVQGTKEKVEPKPEPIPKYAGNGGIDGDFIDCVNTRNKPFRDIEYAVNTIAVPHLAVIAYTLSRSLKWDAAKQRFVGDDEANRFIDRARREPWQL